MDNATAALARMNMVLHDCPTAEIWQANTLSSPHFTAADGRLKTFDFVVANFPFSNKNWTSGLDPSHDPYGRFEYGIPPAKNGDYTYLLHILATLKSTGKGAVIHPHGVLFRGSAEAAIRKRIVRQGFIKGIIGLPANLFYGTGIPACILVLDKEGATGRRGIFMVDASKGYIKDGNKNRLRAQDIHKIVDTFTRQVEIPKYARMVPLAEIEANDFNLNLPRYIDSSEPEDLQDIEAHLKGGIPERDIDALAQYWDVFPNLRASLFDVGAGFKPAIAATAEIRPTSEGSDPVGAGFKPAPTNGGPVSMRAALKVAVADIKATIFDHPEFAAFNALVTQRFAAWKQASLPSLTGIRIGDRPKVLIETLSEALLDAFRSVPLIDAYDIYQHLMNYWAGTMQDDAWMIVSEGWHATQDGRPNTDLIPPTLVVARWFAVEQAAIETLEAEREAIARQMEEMDEEHGGEEGLLADAKNEKGKLSRASVKARLAEIRRDKEAAEERRLLAAYAELIEREAAAGKAVKDAQKALDAKVAAQYAKLSEAEIKTLVVEDKWLAALAASVQGELDRVSQALTGRIRQLAERYAMPLPRLSDEVETLAARVDEHLKKMGFAW
jgi:type I restriction enzyme M protein